MGSDGPFTGVDFQNMRTRWAANVMVPRLMTQEEMGKLDAFFDSDASAPYRDEGFIRAQNGDFSQYENVDPMLKSYLSTKKCMELYDRYKTADNPALQQELSRRLMEVDLRTGFALGANAAGPTKGFFKACGQIANQQMFKQTLGEPDAAAKLRLDEQLKQQDPAKADMAYIRALNSDLAQRIELAKILFLNHLGKFQVYGDNNNPRHTEENISEVYAHGGRTMFILPAGGDQKAMMSGIKGNVQHSGLEGRLFATHSVSPRTFASNGTIAAEAQELRVGRLNSFAPTRHSGMNVSVGGLGQVGPNGKVIAADGTNGHMYMHLTTGGKNTCGMMLVGFENAAVGKSGRLGHAHGPSAKRAGNSAFLSDKTSLGCEIGGRVVDLSGLESGNLTTLLGAFENGYRMAAQTAQTGDPRALNACNDLLTGKVMSIGQVKGMLAALGVEDSSLLSYVDRARAGHPKTASYQAPDPERTPPISLKLGEKEPPTLRITQFAGLSRPEPPKAMKKPGFFDKVMHIFSRKGKSYVSKYEEYQKALPDMMKQYRAKTETYLTTLAELEQGKDPFGLKSRYNAALQMAAAKLNLPSPVKSPTTAVRQEKKESEIKNKKMTSQESLENCILNNFSDLLGYGKNGRANEMSSTEKEMLLGQIRNTPTFKKFIASGDQGMDKMMKSNARMVFESRNIFMEVHDNQVAAKGDGGNKQAPNLVNTGSNLVPNSPPMAGGK